MQPKRGELDRPRRFYTSVSVAPTAGGFAVELDGRAARTPRGALLAAPAQGLAELVAAEWAAQSEVIDYLDMPATRLMHTAIDGVAKARRETVQSVARHAESDLVCYLADAPESLVARQMAAWTPILDWARDVLELELLQTRGIVHQAQPAKTLEKVAAIAEAADDFTLAGLAFAAALFGSAVLALALRAGRIDAVAAHAASMVEETFQEERWGVDAEAAARAARLLADALTLERWFAAARAD